VVILIGGISVFLKKYDTAIEQQLAIREQKAKHFMNSLNDSCSQIVGRMGHRARIVAHPNADADFYSNGFASSTFSESESNIEQMKLFKGIEGVVPALLQKIKWKETKRTCLMVGTGGNVLSDNSAPLHGHEDVQPGHAYLGYELHWGEEISVGQRIAVNGSVFIVDSCIPQQGAVGARALLNSPQIILADEPTGNLDDDNTFSVLDYMTQFTANGGTVLMVTHDCRAAEKADRSIHMENGYIHHFETSSV